MSWTDCCQHGVPYRWPEECIECEMEELEQPEASSQTVKEE